MEEEMPEIYRVRTGWTGFIGGPGVTTMYFLDVATAVASVHTFWSELLSRFPTDVHLQVENVGDIIEDSTGEMTGAWSADAVGSLTGTGDGNYAAPAGCVVNWLTDTVTAGRRLRGKTFLVPLAGGTYDGDGSIGAASLSAIQAAADALVVGQSTSFVVWHRGSGTDGSNGLVTSAKVNDFTAVLTTRRD
jgi:hypothetical protein